MSSVDNRIVSMKFDNASFEKGVSTTISSLDKLKASLNFKDSNNAMRGVQDSINKFTMSPVEGAVTGVSKSFLAMTTVAVTALASITNKAIEAGASIVKSLTIQPITTGFSEYELKMGAIQTIMAGSGASLEEVNAQLKLLNEYSDKTIYSFADMTQNIGKFTNAGISLEQSVAAIKGVANVAAISGANAEEASRAMYNFAQALSSGSVKLQDWKSIELANMGTKEFKEELIKSAVAAGTLEKSADGLYRTVGDGAGKVVSATKGFNESLSEGWLTTEALTETLERYSDSSTDVGKRATAAAQDVKTFSQMLDTLKETAGSGWAETWELVFGDFEESKKLWTGLNQFFGGMISASSDARNAMLKSFIDMGGKKSLVSGLTNVFETLGKILKTVKDAFRDIFPPLTGERLADLAAKFENFTEKMKIGDKALAAIRSTFRGIAAVFSIAKQIIGGAIGVIVDAFQALFSAGAGAGGAGPFLTITSNIGDFLVKVDEMLRKSGAITAFFQTIGGAIGSVITVIKGFVAAFVSMFTGEDSPFLTELSQRFEVLGPIIDTVQNKIQSFLNFMKGLVGQFSIGSLFGGTDASSSTEGLETVQGTLEETSSLFDKLKTAADAVVNSIQTVIEWVSEAFKKIAETTTLEDTLALANTGLLAAVFLTIRNISKQIGDMVESFKNIADSFGGTLDQLTENLKTMQNSIRANILIKIALAILLLAAALYILSQLNVGDLTKSIVAIGLLATIMVKAMKALDATADTMDSKSAVHMTAIGFALIGMAVAILLLAIAVEKLAGLDIQQVAQGLGVVVVLVAMMVKASDALEKSGGAKQLVIAAFSLGVLSAALLLFAFALKKFEEIDTGTLMAGMAKIAGALIVLRAVTQGFPKNIGEIAVSILIIAAALIILAEALKRLAALSLEQLAKSLGTVLIALGIMSKALTSMKGSEAGSNAIIRFAFALLVLGVALKLIGSLPWPVILTALGTLVALFVIFGLAGYILAPVIPVIDLLAKAVQLLGIAALAAGAGMLMFATGLSLLAVVGVGAISILTAAIIAIAELIPLIAVQIGLGIVAFADVIGDKAPEILKAFGRLLDACLEFILEYAPKLYKTVFDLLEGFLRAAAKRMPDILDAGGDLVVAFIKGIAEQDVKIITAGMEAILTFLEGIRDAIDKYMPQIIAAGLDIGEAIIEGILNGLTGGKAGQVIGVIRNLGSGMVSGIKSVLGISSPSKEFEEIGYWTVAGLVLALKNGTKEVVQTSEDMGTKSVTALRDSMKQMSDVIETDMDFQPVIAPVLDLTQFRKEASRIQPMLAAGTVSPKVSFGQAADISSLKTQTSDLSNTSEAVPPIMFEQNNYSPKALSATEIYRNTRSQLSLAKEALAV